MRSHLSPGWLLCACLALGAARLFAQERPLAVAAALQAAVDRHPLRDAKVGVVARRISDGKEVFSFHGNELFELASNTKLFTTAAALLELGADYEFRTALVANGPIQDGVLQGDLVVVGGGDPSFSGRVYPSPMTVPREFVQAIQTAGIRQITGDLVMDDRLFDRVCRAPGWPKADWLWWYSAPISALSFNDNCVEVKVTGGPAPDDPATISTIPSFPAMRFVNHCSTAAKDRPAEATFERGEEGAIVVSGRLPVGVSRSETVAVEEPPLYLAAALETEMAKASIRLDGRARMVGDFEKVQPGAQEIFAWKSKLLDSISAANQRSHNFCAEQIFKTMGAVRFGKGSFESGAAAVHEFTRAAHLPDEAVSLVDGCGLSPDDRATPQAVSALLEVMYRSKMDEAFIGSLATNGQPETTLRNRLTDPAMRGRIHAKTGTIKANRVSALSGYAEATDGEIYAFSVLVNGFRSGAIGAATALEDSICYALVGIPEKEKQAERSRRR
jgi:D-alanyl-D-alanine carboxypeptidase/D-alanyl-D-alanine-endopeptidase (penicillin-binding protein 4)